MIKATMKLFLLLAALACPEARAYRAEEVRGALVYRHIAYAKPPVGARRWRRPEPELKERQRQGPVACPQTGGDDLSEEKLPESEDCLYLNVWAPVNSGKAPVVLLIHGGGLLAGAGVKRFYDGSIFAREGLVLVAFNYRLGELGYGPKRESKPGSLGLLDQAEALRWVERNIDRLGGDPERIFLLGHSKGAEAALALMESGLAGKKVKGALAFSGARHFQPGENRFLPEEQRRFWPGEESESAAAILAKRGPRTYVPELPEPASMPEGHRYRLLVSTLYDERLGPRRAPSWCGQGLALEQYPPAIEAWYYVWHPGLYQHGAEMRSLFRQDAFGKALLGVIARFVRDGEPPGLSLGGKPPAFREGRKVVHFFPRVSFSGDFLPAGTNLLEACPPEQGSSIGAGYRALEKFFRLLGGHPEPASSEELTPPPSP